MNEVFNVLAVEKVTIVGILIGFIVLLIKDRMSMKKTFETKITSLELQLENIQNARMDENRKIIELTIELIQKINQYDGLNRSGPNY
jgi:chaperonin cofactor prefoldin